MIDDNAPMDRVLVDWRKWPADKYRSLPMHRLGHNANGVWLFAPRGTRSTYEGSGGPGTLPVHFVTLVPNTPTWIATWMWGNPSHDIELYIDLVVDPTWESDVLLRVVDMDLDVIRLRSGHAFIDDEDEFLANHSARSYPVELIDMVRESADDLLQAVADRRRPFGAESKPWKAMATELIASDRSVVDQ